MGTVIQFSKTDGTARGGACGNLHTDRERGAYLADSYSKAVRAKRLKIAGEAGQMARALETLRERYTEFCEKEKDKEKAQSFATQTEIINRAFELWCDEIAMLVDTLRDEVAAQLEREHGESARVLAAKLRAGDLSQIAHAYYY